MSIYTEILTETNWEILFGRFYALSNRWHNNGIYLIIKLKRQTMKNSTKTTVILKMLDIELKTLLQTDIRNFKAIRSGQKQLQAQQAA